MNKTLWNISPCCKTFFQGVVNIYTFSLRIATRKGFILFHGALGCIWMHISNNSTFKELITHTFRSSFVLLWLDTRGFTIIFQVDFSALGNFYDMINPMPMKQHWIICMTKWFMMTSSNGNIFRITGPLCGEFLSPVYSPHKDQWRRALAFSLICAWTNGWVNTWDPGDLRHHRAHYGVTVMLEIIFFGHQWL